MRLIFTKDKNVTQDAEVNVTDDRTAVWYGCMCLSMKLVQGATSLKLND